jgi:DNA-binding CsgD family transcriptional regulator
VPNVIETCLETGPVSSLIAALDGSGWIVKTMHRAGCQASVQIEREPAITADSIDLLASLTIREREVLGWIARGKRDAEIALILGMAPRTASKHVEHILSKLSCETRAGAIAIFLGT